MNNDLKPLKVVTVKDLVEYLQKQPQDLPVCYCCYSEHTLLDLDNIKIVELQKYRNDGWIHDVRYYYKPAPPNAELMKYLSFPGN